VSWKEAKQVAKIQSLLAKICDGPMFHLGTTGNDDDEYLMKCEAKSFLNNFLYLQPHLKSQYFFQVPSISLNS
jgi:hypothetical protein